MEITLLVWDEAQNRLYAHQSILLWCLKNLKNYLFHNSGENKISKGNNSNLPTSIPMHKENFVRTDKFE